MNIILMQQERPKFSKKKFHLLDATIVGILVKSSGATADVTTVFLLVSKPEMLPLLDVVVDEEPWGGFELGPTKLLMLEEEVELGCLKNSSPIKWRLRSNVGSAGIEVNIVSIYFKLMI